MAGGLGLTHFRWPETTTDYEITAYWSRQPAGKALVFVHGFRGDVEDTWGDFPNLLMEDERAAGLDIIMYGYDAVNTRARFSALELYAFLDRLFVDPLSVYRRRAGPLARTESFRFHRITVVAHSFGAVVSRQALLEAWIGREPWLPLTRLVLFAPADMGADIAKLKDIWPPLRKAADLSASFFARTLSDLEPGSDALSELRDGVRLALTQPGGEHLRARLVILGKDDMIVSPNRFLFDAPAQVVRGKDHRAICKPTRDFLLPVDALWAVL